MASRISLIAVLCLGSAFAGPAAAKEFEFRLVDAARKPVDWEKQECKYQYRGGLFAPSFKVDVPQGQSTLLGMFKLDLVGDKLAALTPGVKVDGTTVEFDVDSIDRALYCSQAVAWSAGALYVAEPRSIDGRNHYVHKFARGSFVSEKIPTVNGPRAVAVSTTTLFVVGEKELAAFALADGAKQYSQSIEFGTVATQMTLVKDRLYIGDAAAACVRVFNAADGAPVTKFAGEGENKLICPAHDYASIGVAAHPNGNLVVCDATAVREFTVEGKFVRRIAEVPQGMSVAVDAQGNVAVAVVSAKDKDYGFTPEIWKFNAAGKPLVRTVRVYMSGPKPTPDSRLEYFGGILGRLQTPGGVAFDDDGNLYVSDSNRWLRGKGEFFNGAIDSDGGIVKFSSAGDVQARLGTRFGDGASLIAAHLKQRAARLPLARTTAAVKNGKELRLLSWGDSISQCGKDWNGGATKTEYNWCPVLARMLEEQYAPLKVRDDPNGGGGQTAAEGLCRDPGNYAATRGIDLTLIEFGTNDAGYKNYSPQRYAQALRDMVAAIGLLSDTDIVILTVGPLLGQAKLASEDDYIRAAQEVGRELNVPVVNISAAVNRRLAEGKLPFESLHMGPTNVHPNDAGHAVWAQAVLDLLTQELMKTK